MDWILKFSIDWQGNDITSPSYLALILKTSRYQVNKHIKSLKSKGLIEYDSVLMGPEDEFFPPYNGYRLTDSGKEKYKAELKELQDWDRKLIKECFGI
jgi:DNA-binding MarR family transcriptional regulator